MEYTFILNINCPMMIGSRKALQVNVIKEEQRLPVHFAAQFESLLA